MATGQMGHVMQSIKIKDTAFITNATINSSETIHTNEKQRWTSLRVKTVTIHPEPNPHNTNRWCDQPKGIRNL